MYLVVVPMEQACGKREATSVYTSSIIFMPDTVQSIRFPIHFALAKALW
jgi:hypothetical protein